MNRPWSRESDFENKTTDNAYISLCCEEEMYKCEEHYVSVIPWHPHWAKNTLILPNMHANSLQIPNNLWIIEPSVLTRTTFFVLILDSCTRLPFFQHPSSFLALKSLAKIILTQHAIFLDLSPAVKGLHQQITFPQLSWRQLSYVTGVWQLSHLCNTWANSIFQQRHKRATESTGKKANKLTVKKHFCYICWNYLYTPTSIYKSNSLTKTFKIWVSVAVAGP